MSINTAILGNWKGSWKERVAYFNKETGKVEAKVKKASWSKAFFQKFRKAQQKQDTYMERVFGELDAAYKVMHSAKPDQKAATIDKFEAALKSAERLAKGHVGRIWNEAQNAASKKDMTKDEVAAKKRDFDRMLKILSADVDALIGTGKAAVVSRRKTLGVDLRNPAAQIAASKDLDTARARLKGHMKKSGAWLMKQDRKPDVVTFNAGINTACRNLYMQMNMILKNYDKKSNKYQAMAHEMKAINDWANNDKKLSKDTGADKVIIEVSKLKKTFKMIAEIEKML